MSNHYHLIIETPNGNLSQIMKHINSSYTTYYNIKRKRSGHLLHGRYKAILIDGNAYATELSRYIHLNPVRAGIVSVPENYPWMSYRFYIGEKVPEWLTTSFVQGYFSKDIETASEKYKLFVHDLINQVYQSPLLETVASTILGCPEFVRATQERHLNSRKADRDLPSLRELTSRPSLNDIVVAVKNVFPDNERLTTKVCIHLCHRYSGAKLKDIGALFRLTESGVTSASKRFEKSIDDDDNLKEKLMRIFVNLGMSIGWVTSFG
jgi:hypothetical protein